MNKKIKASNWNFKPLYALLSVAISSGAFAQATTTNEENKQNPESVQMETVTITAQKRLQLLKDVPISVTAINGDEMEKRGVTNGFDLIKYLPGFGRDDSNEIRTTTLKTRGIGTFTNSIGLQSSNLSAVDGEVLPRQSMMNLSISDVERVEALRGPQGTLFGQNTSTGLIHYITKKPKLGKSTGSVRAEFAEYNGRSYSGVFNIPLGENFAVRINLAKNSTDGWITNNYPSPDAEAVGKEDGSGGRLQLLYSNNNGFSTLFRADSSENTTNCCGLVNVGVIDPTKSPQVLAINNGIGKFSTFNAVNPPQSYDSFGGAITANEPNANYGSVKNKGLSNETNLEFSDNLTLTYIGSYRDFKLVNSSTQTKTLFPVHRAYFAGDESVKVLQQELRLGSYGNDKFDWTAGLFYHKTKGSRDEQIDACVTGNNATSRAVIDNGILTRCVTAASATAYVNGGGTNTGLLRADRNLTSGEFETNFDNRAIFGQAEWFATKDLTVTMGARWLQEKSGASFNTVGLRPSPNGSGLESYASVLQQAASDPTLYRPGAAPHDATTFNNSNNAFIYKGIVSYELVKDIKAYLGYTTGYKGVSYFLTTLTDPKQASQFPTKPERSTNLELGLRTSLLNNRLLFNATIFDMRVRDFQVRANRVIDEASNLIFAGYVNADEARSKGIELDVAYRPFKSLTLTASYTRFKARFEKFANAPITCPGGELIARCSLIGKTNVFDQTGLPFPNNAEQQAIIGANYTYGFSNGWKGSTNFLGRYQGSYTKSITQIANKGSANPSSRIFDLSFGLDNNSDLQYTLSIKNLFDKPYSTRRDLDQFGNGTGFFPRDYRRFISGSVRYSY